MPGQTQVHYWQTVDQVNSNYEVFAGSSTKNGMLTFGSLRSGLAGLLQFMVEGENKGGGYNKGNAPIVFQINDGHWGEVGTGYVGYKKFPGQRCVVAAAGNKVTPCVDVDSGKIP